MQGSTQKVCDGGALEGDQVRGSTVGFVLPVHPQEKLTLVFMEARESATLPAFWYYHRMPKAR